MHPFIATRVLPLACGAAVMVAPHLAAAQNETLSLERSAHLRPGGGAVTALGFDFEGRRAAVGSSGGRVTVYDLAPVAPRGTWQVPGPVTGVAFSRDGAALAAVSRGGDVTVVDLAKGEQRSIGRRGEATAVAWGADNASIAVGAKDGTVYLYSSATGSPTGRLADGHRGTVVSVTFLPDGATLVSVGADRNVIYWDVKKLTRLRQITDVDAEITAAAMSGTASLLAVGTEDRRQGYGRGNFEMTYRDRLRVYDVASAAPQKEIDLLGRTVKSVSWSPDFHYLATGLQGLRGATLAVWDVERGVSVAELPWQKEMTVVGFSPSGKVLVTGDVDGNTDFVTVKGVVPRVAFSGDLRGRKFVITSPQTPLVTPSRRLRLAVLDLDDNGVGAEVARAIADQVANRLAANPAVRLVERRRLAAIVKEQDFQHSGRTDAQSAVQLARVLNVNKVVLGAVAKLGTTMTITAQLVDVETAAINGVREIQCRACSLEDLSDAVAELSGTLVAPVVAAETDLPPPPQIEIDGPTDGDTVRSNVVLFRARIVYSGSLDGVELLVNGAPLDASRLLADRTGKLTKVSRDLRELQLTQEIPLAQDANVIAVRAVGADGNDEQRYVVVRKAAPGTQATPSSRGGRGGGASRPAPAARPATITIIELEGAIASGVPTSRLVQLVQRFGVAFALDQANETRLKAKGADPTLLAAVRTSVRP